MWKHKDSENVIYIDSQMRLQVPPTLFCDNTKLPFRDGVFHTEFYDPPHEYNWPDSYFSFPNIEEQQVIWKKKSGVPTYYGWEIYKTREELIQHIALAQKELERTLANDGLLWFKWNELKIPLINVLSLFVYWTELMRLFIKSPLQRKKKVQTFWICLEKRGKGMRRTLLDEFARDKNLAEPVLKRREFRSPQTHLSFRRTSQPKRD